MYLVICINNMNHTVPSYLLLYCFFAFLVALTFVFLPGGTEEQGVINRMQSKVCLKVEADFLDFTSNKSVSPSLHTQKIKRNSSEECQLHGYAQHDKFDDNKEKHSLLYFVDNYVWI